MEDIEKEIYILAEMEHENIIYLHQVSHGCNNKDIYNDFRNRNKNSNLYLYSGVSFCFIPK